MASLQITILENKERKMCGKNVSQTMLLAIGDADIDEARKHN